MTMILLETHSFEHNGEIFEVRLFTLTKEKKDLYEVYAYKNGAQLLDTPSLQVEHMTSMDMIHKFGETGKTLIVKEMINHIKDNY